ncbi:hypothetical protein [Brevibacillus sp. BC25]|uniref:hypothetical protein n=1 Tax=Brevibacillus sp. BC25 TaxID=1144308 RepID=UPI00027147CE|nr:hypothetical protein [Brevibacillus sp. BC25]EJL22860.1 hypothetical protein PMI05_04803 [Brevibacillus sp. BC25]
MDIRTEKKPIYDERVNEILRGMVEGKTRDELAKELGHKNYKTLDIYMRRKNFMWDRNKQAYVPIHTSTEKWNPSKDLMKSSMESTILSLFQKEGADAKTIAKRMGFQDHRELATYMKAKGYKWCSDTKNYVKEYGKLADREMLHNEAVPKSSNEDPLSELGEAFVAPRTGLMGSNQMDQYLPILELLERNRGRLIDLIVPGSESGKVPRYAVPGVFVTKSVHMTNTLDQMVREYSKEKNISQRDIFAVALIEFFKRYGYEREISTLIGKV